MVSDESKKEMEDEKPEASTQELADRPTKPDDNEWMSIYTLIY